MDKLANVTTPVLALAGSVDQLAPEHNVRELLGRVSSTDKNLLVCGKHTGFSADFGHIDIMLSTPARLEIYPRIAQWLESHRDVDGTVERGQQEVVQLPLQPTYPRRCSTLIQQANFPDFGETVESTLSLHAPTLIDEAVSVNSKFHVLRSL